MKPLAKYMCWIYASIEAVKENLEIKDRKLKTFIEHDAQNE